MSVLKLDYVSHVPMIVTINILIQVGWGSEWKEIKIETLISV